MPMPSSPLALSSASAVLLALVAAACGSDQVVIQCRDDTSCDRFAGGRCLVNAPTGQRFCAYPDGECASGMRWSDLDVDPSVSGECVVEAADAGVDGAVVDAMIDAPMIDAMIDAMDTDADPGGPIVANGQNAELVLGQPNFTSATENNGGVSARSLRYPLGIAGDGTYLWAVDGGNYRAIRWQPHPETSNASANQVLGQSSLTNGADPGATASANTIRTGNRAAISGIKLLISEGNRVLIWNPLPTSNGQAASLVLCQAEFSHTSSGNAANRCNGPQGIWTDGTRVAVADRGNHRVLIWTSFPTTNGQAANIVLGQSDFGQSGTPSSPTASNLYRPQGVYFDGTRFYVADSMHNRVLVWNGFPMQNGQPADYVIGQPNLTSATAATTQAGLNNPVDVVVAGGALFVSDMTNDRVMVWTPIPTTSGAAAAHVLGASNFTTAGGSPAPTQSSLDGPAGMAVIGDKLFVVDYLHHRVLRFGLNLP